MDHLVQVVQLDRDHLEVQLDPWVLEDHYSQVVPLDLEDLLVQDHLGVPVVLVVH